MNLLGLDTATPACSVALRRMDGKLFSRCQNSGRTHSKDLFALIKSVMDEALITAAEVNGLVCGIGPGSFTGVRIGLGVAKGYAQAKSLEVAPVTSLALLAQQAMQENRLDDGADVIACMDARMNQVYWQRFEVDQQKLRPVNSPSLENPQSLDWSGLFHNAFGIGNGFNAEDDNLKARFQSQFSLINFEALPNIAVAMNDIANNWSKCEKVNANALEPLYLRNNVAMTSVEQVAAREAKAALKALDES